MDQISRKFQFGLPCSSKSGHEDRVPSALHCSTLLPSNRAILGNAARFQRGIVTRRVRLGRFKGPPFGPGNTQPVLPPPELSCLSSTARACGINSTFPWLSNRLGPLSPAFRGSYDARISITGVALLKSTSSHQAPPALLDKDPSKVRTRSTVYIPIL